MAVKTVYDEINDLEVTMVEGVVDQISFKAVENDKFGATHKAGVRIGDDWVNNISLKVNEGFDPQIRLNAGTKTKPDWQTLEVGDEVKIVVQPSEWNGKTYYNSGVSKIRLVKKGAGGSKSTGQAPGGQQKAFNSFKKDMSGIVAGNGFNAAKALLGTYEDGEDFVKTAISLVEIGQKIRKQLKDSRTDLDEYSIGAQSGMALIAACEVAEYISEVEDIANSILNVTLPKITEYVKEMENKTESPVKKTVSKKTAVKKPTKKLDPEISEYTTEPEFEEDDDSLPF